MSAKVVVHGEDHTVEGSWDSSDEWDRPDTYFSYNGIDVYASDDEDPNRISSFYSDLFDVDVSPGDEVFVVLCRYSTGDTFGNDGGRVSVMGVFKDSHYAEMVRHQLETPESEGKPYSFSKTYAYSKTIDGVEYYIPWSGYFEQLESLFIERAIVRHA